MGLKEVCGTVSVDVVSEEVILNYEQYILDSEKFLRSAVVRSFFRDRGFYTDCSERGTSVGFDDFRSDILLKMISYFELKCFYKESSGEKLIKLRTDSIPRLVFRCAKNHQIDIYRKKIVEEIFLNEVEFLMSTINSTETLSDSVENYLDTKKRASSARESLNFDSVSKIAKDKKIIPRVTKKADQKEFVDGVLHVLSDASEGFDLKMNPSGSDMVNSFIHAKGRMLAAKTIRKNRDNKARLRPVVEALQLKSQEIRDQLNESNFFKRLTSSSIIKPSEMKLYKLKNKLDNIASKIRSSWDNDESLLKVITEEGFKSIEDLEAKMLSQDHEKEKACA